jgi:sialic acid synthase SpsE
MTAIKIGDHLLGEKNPCFIAAEAGSNFRVSENADKNFKMALRLIDIAADAGADAVKFQTFQADEIYVPNAEITSNLRNKVSSENAHALLKKLEMPREWIPELSQAAERKGILFLSTPFDLDAVDALNPHVPYFKIGSMELMHYPLLRKAARTNKPIVLSTGMANLGDVEAAVDAVVREGNDQIVLLHCTSNYPTRPEDVHLRSMLTLKNAFPYVVGFSDHTEKNYQAFAARALGAVLIEKHFTHDKAAEGPDHAYALSPSELEDLVTGIRSIERSMGDRAKKMRPSEIENFEKASRSLFFKRDLKTGDRVEEEDILVNRPAAGLHPRFIDIIIGKKLKKDVRKYEPILWESFL